MNRFSESNRNLVGIELSDSQISLHKNGKIESKSNEDKSEYMDLQPSLASVMKSNIKCLYIFITLGVYFIWMAIVCSELNIDKSYINLCIVLSSIFFIMGGTYLVIYSVNNFLFQRKIQKRIV